MSRVRIGCDPEIFVADSTTGVPVPITGKIGGTKERPRFLDKTDKFFSKFGKMNGWALQEDGAALEFNTPAFQSVEDFAGHVSQFIETLDPYLASLGLRAIRAPTATFDSTLRDASPKAFILGCDPDFNAYTEQQNPIYDVNQMGLTRFAAGHIHLGYDVSKIPHNVMAKFCDLFIGLPSIAKDKQGRRRQFYGQAGNYRPKKYGIEYRTPSNYWIWNVAGGRHEYRMMTQAIRLAGLVDKDPDGLVKLYKEIPWDNVRVAINTEDIAAARKILAFSEQISQHLVYSLAAFDEGVKNAQAA